MMNNIQLDVSKKSAQIRQSAEQVLAKLSLATALVDIGELGFTGSYALDLMTWNDIDCQIKLFNEEEPEQVFGEIITRLFGLKGVKNLKLINFIKNPKPTMPIGLYCGVHYHYEGEVWKIDIWYLPEKEYTTNQLFTQRILSKLTPELRETILKWKFYFMGNDSRMPHLLSYYLYQAILLQGLHEEAQIKHFLKENGVQLD